MKVRVTFAIAVAFVIMVNTPGLVSADIFVRIDKSGHRQFSNTPQGSGWELYAKEPKGPTEIEFVGKTLSKSLDDIINEIALIYQVDADLVRAIVRVESNSNPLAVSRKGAQGLMQLMPATARQLNVHSPFDPRENIIGGVKYIKELLGDYGDLKLALAAYNAGPAAVKKYSGVPPYRETKQYIKKVLKFYKKYRKQDGVKIAVSEK